MLDVAWQGLPEFDFETSLVENWLSRVCLEEERLIEAISLVFMTDDGLLEMNQQFLSHDYYTDIITFDYSEKSHISGDLFISIDRVKENANERSLDWLNELNRVIVHGVLHLIGYGDKGKDEESLMRSKEDFYLNKLKGFT